MPASPVGVAVGVPAQGIVAVWVGGAVAVACVVGLAATVSVAVAV